MTDWQRNNQIRSFLLATQRLVRNEVAGHIGDPITPETQTVLMERICQTLRRVTDHYDAIVDVQSDPKEPGGVIVTIALEGVEQRLYIGPRIDE